jgi:two-component system sensor histidine kinase KdpD
VSSRRLVAGWALALAGVPVATLALAQLRSEVGFALVVLTAAVGGTVHAVVAAIAALLVANSYFRQPYYRWTIAEAENVVALVVFLGVALVVSGCVAAAARRATEAAGPVASSERCSAGQVLMTSVFTDVCHRSPAVSGAASCGLMAVTSR